MKNLERVQYCVSSCYREGVSFIDKDGFQVAYQKVFIFNTRVWHYNEN